MSDDGDEERRETRAAFFFGGFFGHFVRDAGLSRGGARGALRVERGDDAPRHALGARGAAQARERGRGVRANRVRRPVANDRRERRRARARERRAFGSAKLVRAFVQRIARLEKRPRRRRANVFLAKVFLASGFLVRLVVLHGERARQRFESRARAPARVVIVPPGARERGGANRERVRERRRVVRSARPPREPRERRGAQFVRDGVRDGVRGVPGASEREREDLGGPPRFRLAVVFFVVGRRRAPRRVRVEKRRERERRLRSNQGRRLLEGDAG